MDKRGAVGTTSVGQLLRFLDHDACARDIASPPHLPDALAKAASRIADAARRGGRVIVSGTPETASDVDHVVVEFVHPVITGARSVGAIACHETEPDAIQRWLQDVARPSDIVVAVASSSADPAVGAASSAASGAGASVLTLANRGDADIVVGSIDGIAAKELRVVAYHVLWELVQMSLAAS